MSAVGVVGSFMMDLVASAPRRPGPGETVVGTDFATYLGGKGFNQAVAAARAGARTAMIGRVGADEYGDAFRAALRDEGVDGTGVVADPYRGTGVGLPVVEPGGQNSIIVVPRANAAVDPAQVRAGRRLIEAADVLLLQLELPVAAAVEASRIAHRAGTLVVLNPAPYAPAVDELREYVDVLVPNEVELQALAGGGDPASQAPDGLPGGPLGGPAGVEAAADLVRKRWSTDLVATLGPAGVLVLAVGGAPIRLPARPVAAVDTVGAGDTFCAHLAVGLAGGVSLTEAARRATYAAALTVTRPGGADSAPYRAEVEAFLAAPAGESEDCRRRSAADPGDEEGGRW